jgi:hypothetical protein
MRAPFNVSYHATSRIEYRQAQICGTGETRWIRWPMDLPSANVKSRSQANVWDMHRECHGKIQEILNHRHHARDVGFQFYYCTAGFANSVGLHFESVG